MNNNILQMTGIDENPYFKKILAEQRRAAGRPAEESVDDYFLRITGQSASVNWAEEVRRPACNSMTDEQFRNLIGASPGARLAPVLEQIRPYISYDEVKAISDCGLKIMTHQNLLSAGNDSLDREYFRQFAAGIQHAYEQMPWPPDSKVDFQVDANTAILHPAYVIAYLRDGVPVKEINPKLALTAYGIAKLRIQAAHGFTISRRYESGTYRYDANEEAFRLGMEEGRHLSQHFVPEAFTQDRKKETSEVRFSYEDIMTNTPELAERHAKKGLEEEGRQFEEEQLETIFSKSRKLSAIPLPLVPSQQR
jgi:hypothetical protein